jgi:glycosyltransferase involved in cell wall biosynthesis
MRIAIYNPGWHVVGGGEKYLGTVAEILSEHNQVDLIISRPVDLSLMQRRLGLNLERVGVVEVRSEIASKPRTVGEWLKNRAEARRLQSELQRLTRNYDLAVYLESDYPLRLAARRNILHLQVPHRRWRAGDFLGAIGENRLAECRREFFRLLTFRRSLQHFDLIIFNSDFTARVIKENWRPTIQSVVIHPPIDMPQESVSWAAKRNYILGVGRFFAGGHEKRQQTIVRAFQAFCERNGGDWELHLVGGADDSAETASLINQLKHSSRNMPVHFHVNADRSELMELYRASKFFWHAAGFGVDDRREPERVEHFGIVVAEAMAHGCIPLAMNRGGLREIIQHGVNGYLWESTNGLIEFTSKLLTDKTAPTMSAKARERSDDFSREKFRQRILAYLSNR